jgi:hypothetical protein
MNRASGRTAFILATGILVALAAPSVGAASPEHAAAGSKSDGAGAPVALSKYGKHHRHHAHRGSDEGAKPSAKKDGADAAAAPKDASASEIPPQVANANAQFATADTPSGIGQQPPQGSAPQAAPASQPLSQPPAPPDGDSQVVATDQLNDVDRTLQQGPAPATPVAAQASTDAPAATDAPAPRPAPVMAASSDSSTWDQTSLIGKIFIGFGALLTLASAARMFMA